MFVCFPVFFSFFMGKGKGELSALPWYLLALIVIVAVRTTQGVNKAQVDILNLHLCKTKNWTRYGEKVEHVTLCDVMWRTFCPGLFSSVLLKQVDYSLCDVNVIFSISMCACWYTAFVGMQCIYCMCSMPFWNICKIGMVCCSEKLVFLKYVISKLHFKCKVLNEA